MTSPLLWVLWVHSAFAWGFHGVLIGPGWASIAVADDERECVEMRDTLPLEAKYGHAALCLPASMWPQGRIAEGL